MNSRLIFLQLHKSIELAQTKSKRLSISSKIEKIAVPAPDPPIPPPKLLPPPDESPENPELEDDPVIEDNVRSPAI